MANYVTKSLLNLNLNNLYGLESVGFLAMKQIIRQSMKALMGGMII